MSEKNSKEVVINLDTLGVPIAIVVSAIIIAGVIFLVSRGNSNTGNVRSGSDSPVVEGDSDTGSKSDISLSIGDDPYLGDIDSAKVAIVEFSDYQCGYCQRHSEQTFPSIKENYVDTGKVVYVFKEFPLSSAGQMGYTIAEGGACVFNLSGSEKFAEYHKGAFFAETKSALISLVKGLGVNEVDFAECVDDGRYRDEVSADASEGKAVGISGTPGFVVGVLEDDGKISNGTLISGAYPYDMFVSAIEKLLK